MFLLFILFNVLICSFCSCFSFFVLVSFVSSHHLSVPFLFLLPLRRFSLPFLSYSPPLHSPRPCLSIISSLPQLLHFLISILFCVFFIYISFPPLSYLALQSCSTKPPPFSSPFAAILLSFPTFPPLFSCSFLSCHFISSLSLQHFRLFRFFPIPTSRRPFLSSFHFLSCAHLCSFSNTTLLLLVLPLPFSCLSCRDIKRHLARTSSTENTEDAKFAATRSSCVKEASTELIECSFFPAEIGLSPRLTVILSSLGETTWRGEKRWDGCCVVVYDGGVVVGDGV